jgi:hypothetical protein
VIKKYYSSLAETNIVVLFILCFTVVLLVNIANKLMFFAFGSGDLFYSIYNNIRSELSFLNLMVLDRIAPALMFMGSFYGTIIKSLFFVFSITVHAAIIQFILHIFIRPPLRFSITLGVFYITSIFFYVLNLVPYIGGVIFSFLLLIYTARGIAGANGFSKFRGFLLVISPLLFFPIIGFVIFISVFKVFSLF